jgi:AAA domain-containing protein
VRCSRARSDLVASLSAKVVRDHVLITGPAGSGKSRLARYFRRRGRNAFDADEVPGLCFWVDRAGNPKEVTPEEWRTMEGIQWFWSTTQLDELLRGAEEIYLFGSADNQYEFLSRFDRRYYLRASSALISARLEDPRRDNDFGRGPVQRELVLRSLPVEEERARKAGFEFLDASESPPDIFNAIAKKVPSR